MATNEELKGIVLLDEDLDAVLMHHGIKGMKWGVWNAETRAKYLGSGRKALASAAKRISEGGSALGTQIKKKASSGVSSIKTKYATAKTQRAEEAAHKKAEKEELKQQRKEIGMSRADFNELRKTTLKSHDPSVVARGMSTLTDQELADKIKRLQNEDKIAKMATSQAKARHDVKAARNEALNKNPLVSIGRNVLEDTLKKSVNSLGYETVVQEALKPVLQQKMGYWKDSKLLEGRVKQHLKENPGDDAQIQKEMKKVLKEVHKQERAYEAAKQTEETIKAVRKAEKSAGTTARQQQWDKDVADYKDKVAREAQLETFKRVADESAKRAAENAYSKKLEKEAKEYSEWVKKQLNK